DSHMQEKSLQTRARKSKAKTAPAPAPKPPTGEESGKTPGHKIFPRNLTAQADYLVPGNPAISRPEDVAPNCFPGLELDVANLDRRFLPGLVFNFVTFTVEEVRGMHYGAKLVYVDVPEDPDLGLDPDTAARLSASLGITREEIQTLYDDITNATEL